MKRLTAFLITAILLASCSGVSKKVVVFSKGDPKINEEAKTVEVDDGAGHEAKEVIFSDGSVDLKLTTPRENTTVNIPGNGLYVLNTQKDTIVGSFISYGENAIKKFTQEDIIKQIDSLKQLTMGKNVSAGKRNFFILPNTAAKITDNIEAIIIAPFHSMKSVEAVNGKAPDVFRFYTTQEIRENIEKAKLNLDKHIVDSLNKSK